MSRVNRRVFVPSSPLTGCPDDLDGTLSEPSLEISNG